MCESMVDIQHLTAEDRRKKELECGPMPNMMAALLNIDGTSVQRRKVWVTPAAGVQSSNAANI